MKILHFALRRVAFSYCTFVTFVLTFGKGAGGYNGSVLTDSQILGDPFPYDFPDQTHLGTELFPMRQCHGLKLEEATIDHLQQWMTAGKLTSQQLVTCYIQRITQTDGYARCVVLPASRIFNVLG